MFNYDSERHHFWFNRNSFESDSQVEQIACKSDTWTAAFRQFKLIGALLGMAIYNSVILDVRFPMVVFKKLMGESVGLHDLEDYDAALFSGFKQMLGFDGNVAETFCRKFVVRLHSILPALCWDNLRNILSKSSVKQKSSQHSNIQSSYITQ